MNNKAYRVGKTLFAISTTFLVVFAILFGFNAIYSRNIGLFIGHPLSAASITNIAVDMACIACALPLFLNIAYNKNKSRSLVIFELIILFDLLNLYVDEIAWWVDGLPGYRWLNILDNTLFYFNGYVMLFLFYMYIRQENYVKGKVYKVIHIVLAIGFILMTILVIGNGIYAAISPGKGIFYSISENNVYRRESLYFINLIYFGLVYIAIAYLLFMLRPHIKKLLSYLSYVLIPFGVTVIQSIPQVYGFSFMYPACFVAIAILYINVQLEKDKELARMEFEVEEQKSINILSQVQPHFLYNVLNSIYYLADKDSELTKDAIDKFSRYLRASLNIKQNTGLITLKEEMDYVNLYVNLELIRFEGQFEVQMDIKDYDLKIPRLSIQPLVENAIKHGLSMKETGGILYIKEYSDEDHYYIIIENNGEGFDTSKPYSSDRSHIGVESVRYRLNHFENGTLEIKSDIETGTKCTIIIPRGGGKEDANFST